jgi:hypothetical protein
MPMAAHGIDRWTWSSSHRCAAAVLLDLVEVVKIVNDVLLFKVAVTRAARRSNSSSLRNGEGRPRGEQRLGELKGVLDGQQVVIARNDLQG